MQESQPRFVPLAAKSVVCHTISYFLMGALAYHFLHYADTMNNPNSGMRPTTSIWILLGPSLQTFRGILFASVFFPFREQLFGRRDGWLRMAWMLIGIGILGTFAAAPGSLERFIFTTTPALSQTKGYLEVVAQAVLLSALLCYWVNHSGKKWMNWTLGVGYVVCAGLPLLVLVVPKRQATRIKRRSQLFGQSHTLDEGVIERKTRRGRMRPPLMCKQGRKSRNHVPHTGLGNDSTR